MSDLTALTVILGVLALAGLLSLWFWVWAWIAGPAIRHLAKCAAQGWMQGLAKWSERPGPAAMLEKVGMLPPQPPVEHPVSTPPQAPKPAKPEPPPQYTITGRRIK